MKTQAQYLVALTNWRRDRRGTIAILSAVLAAVALGAAALAIDAGSLYTERRTLQGVSDLAAIAAASQIDRAEAAVAATLEANDITALFTVERGQYTPDLNTPHTQRFATGLQPYNAVRVHMAKPGRLYFAHTFTDKTFEVGVTSTAANAALATFSVGSRLLAVRDGVANKVLGALTGSQIALSMMDYEALVKADVQLAQFMGSLAARMNITAGTYNDVLKSSATLANVISAAAAVTEKNGDAEATAALKQFLNQSGGLSQRVSLKSLIDLGPLGSTRIGDPAPGLDAMLSVMDLVSVSSVLANGNRQVQIDLTANVPGVLSLKLDIAIGEPAQQSAWTAVGRPDSRVRTTQSRMRLIVEVGGTGALAGSKVKLPLYLDLAYGEARLASITCSSSGAPTATIAARSGIAEAWIGEVSQSEFKDLSIMPNVVPANIVDMRRIKVRGRAHLDVGSVSETMLSFDNDDVANRTIKRTSTSSLAQSVMTSLLRDVSLSVEVLGLGAALPGTTTAAVADALAPVVKPIDDVVFGLLTTLGVHLGEADVRVHGMRCGSGMLAG